MSYLHIEDFKSGLDTRKSRYTAPPGSLRVLNNGHITRGGEIEKRKALVPFATLPAGTFGLHSVRNQLYVFGSIATPGGMPGTINYQRLQHASGPTAMSQLLYTESFNGRVYAIAEYADGAVFHFYNGVRVTEWDTLAANLADEDSVAQAFADKITSLTDFNAVAVDEEFTVTAPVAGVGFSYDTNAAYISANVTQANQPAVSEVLAEGSFRINAGTNNPGTNTVASVTVDGVEILGAAVDWATSNSATALAVANQINTYSSSTEYTASVDGDRVVITALAGTGSAPNGYVVEATPAGDVGIANVQNMSGGVDAVAAQAQSVEFTVLQFDPDYAYWVQLDGIQYNVLGSASGVGRVALAFDDKMYSAALSTVYFSGFRGTPPLPDPTAWDGAVGSGFINISTQSGGSDNLKALGIYQDYLVVLAELATQLWSVDADPDLNQKIQTLSNIGTSAHRSVVSFGDIDLFFLAGFGVRSLRARDSSNLASTQDVGTPIDDQIVNYLLSLSDDVRNRAVGVVEPLSGRYLLAVGSVIYVFSHFPASDVAAWSTYEADSDVTDFAVANNRVYARAGDEVYLYGGSGGTEYDDTSVEVELPFLDFGLPATEKTLHSIDVGCEGTWEIWLRPDPNNVAIEERLGEISQSTYGLQGRFPIDRSSTHFALRFRSIGPGYARIGNVVLHYSGGKAD